MANKIETILSKIGNKNFKLSKRDVVEIAELLTEIDLTMRRVHTLSNIPDENISSLQNTLKSINERMEDFQW